MRRTFILVFCLTWNCTVLQSDAQTADGPVEITTIKEQVGTVLPVKQLSVRASKDFEITFATVNVARYSLMLVLPRDRSAGGSSLEGFFSDEEQLAVMPGGFIDSY